MGARYVGIWLMFAGTVACNPSGIKDARPFVDSPLGGPCVDDTNCVAGLICSTFLRPDPNDGLENATSICTVGCASGGCAEGTICMSGKNGALLGNDGGVGGICVVTCRSESDCFIGGRAQACTALIDGGPQVCRSLRCLGNVSEPTGNGSCAAPTCLVECPDGFECVSNEGEAAFCQSPMG